MYDFIAFFIVYGFECIFTFVRRSLLLNDLALVLHSGGGSCFKGGALCAEGLYAAPGKTERKTLLDKLHALKLGEKAL